MSENRKNLPAGFESGKSSAEAVYKKQEVRAGAPTQVNMRRGPGRSTAAVEHAHDAKGTLKRLIRYFRNARGLMIALLASVCAVTLTSLWAPGLQGDGIDLISGMLKADSPAEVDGLMISLTRTITLLLAVYGANMLFSLGQTLFSAHLSQSVVKRMRHDLFDKIDHLPISYLDTHSNGDVMSRMTNDVENVSSTISQSLGSLVSGILTIAGTVAIMFVYCWQLTLITMVTVIMTVAVTKYMSRVMRRVYRKRSRVLGQLNGHSEEMITGYKSIVAYNRQDQAIEEFDALSDELTRVGIRAEILGGSMGPIMNCISNIGFVIVSAFGGYFAFHGIISVGAISAFVIYAKQFSRPINDIAQLYGTLQTAVAGAERVFELIDHPDEDRSGTEKMACARGEICFDHVSFGYTPDKTVLFDFDLDVKPGQKIALVGATGSGKTTVVNLLMRFYPIDSGSITVDGRSIYDIDRDELRRNIAIVLQDTVLFSDTIKGNIAYSRRDASEEEIREAAKMANCDGFIEKLPEGYDTFLKQAGANLSEGQRQLLAIARAVLADPKILILDEATSSVDTRTEKNIQDAMVRLMKNRTSLIIAHRLSTIRDADRIIVMDKGRIAESGSHDELIQKKGKYYDLYMTQFAGNAT